MAWQESPAQAVLLAAGRGMLCVPALLTEEEVGLWLLRQLLPAVGKAIDEQFSLQTSFIPAA